MASNGQRKRKPNYIFIPNDRVLRNNNQESLVVKSSPKDKKSLCVNAKKVNEVENWLNAVFAENNGNLSRVLILRGPSGAGKTATIQVLCHELTISVTEFSETLYCVQKNEFDDEMQGITDPLFCQESQISRFKRFLLEASSKIQPSSRRTLILLEEFPTEFKRDPSQFLVMVDKFIDTFSIPIVFIVNSPSSTDLSLCKFFPEWFLRSTNAIEIVFNAVTVASIVSVLKNICNDCIAKDNLKKFAETCGGDIRNAINTFEVKYGHLLKNVDVNVSRSKKPKKDDCEFKSNLQVAGRECCPSFFHVLGKILYSKREEEFEESSSLLPAHLWHCARKKLKEKKIEDTIDSLSVRTDTLDSYLHEHYLKFTCNLSQVYKCASGMSDADACFGQISWQFPPMFSRIQNYTNVRNLMYNLVGEQTNRRNAFYNFTKPVISRIQADLRETKIAKMKSNNFALHSSDDYLLNIAPYVSLMSDASNESMKTQNCNSWKNASNSKPNVSHHFNSSSEITTNDEPMYSQSDDEITIEDVDFL
ncbi:cell cycle checkpoint protein RAD17-like isoform X1 [Leptotrombidium deliense]|uniref:Cell cycle checkpoint protein RAD17-like isoform X1 n=1 Tax=Leptotrombidium deliense TaxID=299467 RepID=A0A443SJJ0_9ACAR|nr:cell cycle checkpoint protein RAD17-like isoform X1 [Leptotrombidium deliense]